MDPRRFVILAAALTGAATVAPAAAPAATTRAPAFDPRPYGSPPPQPPREGRRAIVDANLEARTASRSDRFEGGVQVFVWSPGRVYEVWTAPLRVSTISLAPGEALLSKAAGDTVRWQLGEVRSGGGGDGRVHVLIKPMQRGLETNLVLTTDRRVYLIALRSGPVESFNPAVAWDTPAVEPVRSAVADNGAAPGGEATPPVRPVAVPVGPLDARYRIESVGRRVAWTPTAVFDDGRRTFIAFSPDLALAEAPALFSLSPDGEAQFVNYRQAGNLFVVDRLLDRAELRLGDRRPRVVRIRRIGDRS